jgi:DNA-binding MarR family transcriptional regulator
MALAPVPSAQSDVAALVEGLRPVLLRLSRELRRESQRVGLSPLDALLLGWIKKHPGIGVSELAEVEPMSRPSMSAHVKRLETAGWIARAAADPEDKRRVGLSITPAGLKALDAVRRRRNDWLATRLSALSPEARRALAGAIAALEQVAGAQP